jgi:hypothetical protein
MFSLLCLLWLVGVPHELQSFFPRVALVLTLWSCPTQVCCLHSVKDWELPPTFLELCVDPSFGLWPADSSCLSLLDSSPCLFQSVRPPFPALPCMHPDSLPWLCHVPPAESWAQSLVGRRQVLVKAQWVSLTILCNTESSVLSVGSGHHLHSNGPPILLGAVLLQKFSR